MLPHFGRWVERIVPPAAHILLGGFASSVTGHLSQVHRIFRVIELITGALIVHRASSRRWAHGALTAVVSIHLLRVPFWTAGDQTERWTVRAVGRWCLWRHYHKWGRVAQ